MTFGEEICPGGIAKQISIHGIYRYLHAHTVNLRLVSIISGPKKVSISVPTPSNEPRNDVAQSVGICVSSIVGSDS
jgi:hypothetical protein